MMRIMILLAALLLVGVSALFAQQDPDDPGMQDSLIIVCPQQHVDSSGEYQAANIYIYAVTDDSIFYYNFPLQWHAPFGGVSPAGTHTQYFYPINTWDVYFDTAITGQGYIRQFGINNLHGQSSPPLLTNGQRLHVWSLRFTFAPNTPSQLVVFDTCYDSQWGSVEFSNEMGNIAITPGIQRGFIYFGAINGAEDMSAPGAFTLSQNYPNPFNAATRIEFSLPSEMDAELAVYDILGRSIRTLAVGRLPAGEHSAIWDGLDNSGRAARSGVYFYALRTAEQTITRKMQLIK